MGSPKKIDPTTTFTETEQSVIDARKCFHFYDHLISNTFMLAKSVLQITSKQLILMLERR